MLQSLRIRNLAVVEDLTWELEPGLNVLTGETGAGKSILIDAFNLLLGERADKSLIREGADTCSVEGVVTGCGFLAPMLEAAGIEPEENGELLLKRVFSSDKPGKQWVNGGPVTLQILKSLGDALADIHGPHDHQSLLSVEEQLKALDNYAGLESAVDEHRTLFRSWKKAQDDLAALQQTDFGKLAQRLDFLDHQIGEIERAALREGEEEELEKAFERASHHQRILEVFSQCQSTLSEGDGNVLDQLAVVQRLLAEWERLDSAAAPFRETNESLVSQITELLRDMEHLSDRAELDPARLAEIEARLDVIKSLQRKHGPTVSHVLQSLESLRSERDELGGREERAEALRKTCAAAERDIITRAAALTKQRKKHAPMLADAITAQLRFLGFAQSNFEIRIEPLDLPRSHGADRVEFYFSPNPGEGARPLKAVASSGEMARVMLAVKSVLAAADQVPVLIFDEVDANVGGETAVAVGRRLRDLAANHQVLCITHLPQVAAAGHAHFRVEKSVEKGRTLTRLVHLDRSDRESELARMLGGRSASALGLARNLIEELSENESN